MSRANSNRKLNPDPKKDKEVFGDNQLFKEADLSTHIICKDFYELQSNNRNDEEIELKFKNFIIEYAKTKLEWKSEHIELLPQLLMNIGKLEIEKRESFPSCYIKFYKRLVFNKFHLFYEALKLSYPLKSLYEEVYNIMRVSTMNDKDFNNDHNLFDQSFSMMWVRLKKRKGEVKDIKSFEGLFYSNLIHAKIDVIKDRSIIKFPQRVYREETVEGKIVELNDTDISESKINTCALYPETINAYRKLRISVNQNQFIHALLLVADFSNKDISVITSAKTDDSVRNRTKVLRSTLNKKTSSNYSSGKVKSKHDITLVNKIKAIRKALNHEEFTVFLLIKYHVSLDDAVAVSEIINRPINEVVVILYKLKTQYGNILSLN